MWIPFGLGHQIFYSKHMRFFLYVPTTLESHVLGTLRHVLSRHGRRNFSGPDPLSGSAYIAFPVYLVYE